ncbi:MAG: hypothetical protein U1D06_15005 [Paracoccaceae bacterium]|nr:hypothetical protein [Paracoccaceae bacterium]
MNGRDWQAFDTELRARAPEIAAELLGKSPCRAGEEWRWGRKGSLSVVIGGAKAGMWFDHEAGDGGGLVDLVAREKGFSRNDALDWTADRIGMAGTFRASDRRQRNGGPAKLQSSPRLLDAPSAHADPQVDIAAAPQSAANADEVAACAVRI